MEKKETKHHIPILSAFGIHIFTIILLLVLQVEFINAINYYDIYVVLSIVNAVILLLVLVMFVLSLSYLWNKPLIFSKDGILDCRWGRKVLFKWDDIVQISVKVKHMGRYYRVIMSYNNKMQLVFEPNSLINKTISSVSNEEVIKKYYEVVTRK